MAPNNVLKHRRTEPLTPYKPSAWRSQLDRHGLLEKYPNLHHSLTHGFNLGIPSISKTYVPANNPSINKLPAEYEEIVEKEFQKGRYIGPFSRKELEAIIGPFQSSPLSLVPKPGKPGKYRAVHDFSHPRQSSTNPISSINSTISSHNFPCTWGTFSTICLIIFRLPPGSQASIRDVAEAYRTIPVHHDQWPGLVVRLREDDSFAANICNNFGLASAGGVHGLLADAGADLFRANGMGPISKWVDDHIFFRIRRCHLDMYNSQRRSWNQTVASNGGRIHEGSRIWYKGNTMPNGRPEEFDEDMATPLRDLAHASARPSNEALYTYADNDIDDLSEKLGIPWEVSKTIPFGSVVPYLGFSWDLNARTVAVPAEKKLKYLNAIEEWEKKPTHALAEVQRLYGKLLHVSLVIPAGRAYLTNLEAMLSGFNNSPFVPQPHPATRLTTLNGGRSSFVPLPSQETSLGQFPLQTSTPSQMPAPVSASASQLATNGAPGACYQAGKLMDEILAGPRPSVSNSSPSLSYHPAATVLTSRFMETTKELLKDGGKAVVETNR
jgi:hypothetical protein